VVELAQKEMTNVCEVLVGSLEAKRPHRRCRGRWKDYIEMNFDGTGYESVNWVYLTQDMMVQNWALLTMVMNLRFHKTLRIFQVMEVFCFILVISQWVSFC
jgi:hypothetical protein